MNVKMMICLMEKKEIESLIQNITLLLFHFFLFINV